MFSQKHVNVVANKLTTNITTMLICVFLPLCVEGTVKFTLRTQLHT